MKLSILFLSMVITATIYGQPNFSGTWKLNADKSKFDGVDPSTAAAVNLVVDQKPGTITVQRDKNPKISLKIDSTAEIEIAGSNGNKTKRSIKPTPDKNGLIETSIYVYPEGQTGQEAKRIKTWSLAADKNTLIVEDKIELNDGQVVEMTLTYDRQ